MVTFSLRMFPHQLLSIYFRFADMETEAGEIRSVEELAQGGNQTRLKIPFRNVLSWSLPGFFFLNAVKRDLLNSFK